MSIASTTITLHPSLLDTELDFSLEGTPCSRPVPLRRWGWSHASSMRAAYDPFDCLGRVFCRLKFHNLHVEYTWPEVCLLRTTPFPHFHFLGNRSVTRYIWTANFGQQSPQTWNFACVKSFFGCYNAFFFFKSWHLAAFTVAFSSSVIIPILKTFALERSIYFL